MHESITILWLGEASALFEAACQQYSVVHVPTADLLLLALKTTPAPYTVVDLGLPDLDAAQLLPQIRSTAPATRIVALVDGPESLPAPGEADSVLRRTASSPALIQALDSLERSPEAAVVAVPEADQIAVLQHRVEHLEGLLRSALNVPGSIQESNILAELNVVARSAVDADDVALLLVDQDYTDISDSLRLGGPEAYVETCRAYFQSLSPEQRAAYVGDEVLLRELPPDQTPASVAAREAEIAGARSYMRLPLVIDDELVGFVGLFSATPGRFGGSHLQLGRLFAAQIATAVRNLRIYFRLNRAEQRQKAVGEVARLIAGDLAPDRVLTRIVEQAVRLIDADAGAVALSQEDRSLVVGAVTGLPIIPVGYRFEPGQGMTGMVALTRQPYAVYDYHEWEHAIPELMDRIPRGAVVLGIPLIYQGRVLGVLQALTERMGPSEAAEAQEVLSLLAPQAATAIGKAQLHETVRQERQQLRAILDHTAAGVLVFDAVGRVQLMNPEAQRIVGRMGLEYEAILGRRVDDLLGELAPEERIERDDVKRIIEVDLGPAGEYLVHIAQILSPMGKVERYVAVAQDISQLRRLDRMKSDLIHILSHDLRNPLGLARGSIDLLDEPDLDAEQRQQLTGMIINSLERMEQLIQDVSDLEMAESLGQETAQPYQLPALVQRVVTRHLPKAERQGLTLNYREIQVPPGPLRGHAILIGQAVDNLVGNAIKYTPPGGVVDVTLDVEYNFAVVRVADTGFGIPEESLPYIFDQFYRVHNEETRNIPGTGLGLSLVQTIARAHGGHITVHSVLDKGSEFALALPLEPRIQVAAPANKVKRVDLSSLVRGSDQ